MNKKELFISDLFKNNIFYTGVGSRKTPIEIGNLISNIAYNISKYCKKIVLRTGDASGADYFFSRGVIKANGFQDVYKASHCTQECLEIVKKILGNQHYYNLSPYAKKLHGRNMQQVMGLNLNNPSAFLICWTPNGESIGGTKSTIEFAKQNNIIIYNLFFEDIRNKFIEGFNLK